MGSAGVRLHRWDEIALEKVTEMLSRKIVSGEREMLVQVYVKRGCLVPMHAHDSEQMTYVLQGALKFLIHGEEITVRGRSNIEKAYAEALKKKTVRNLVVEGDSVRFLSDDAAIHPTMFSRSSGTNGITSSKCSVSSPGRRISW